jgi:hypothetical protein
MERKDMIEAITATGLEPAQAAASPSVSNPQATHNDLRDFAAAMERSGAANGTQSAEVGAPQAAQSSDGMRNVLAAFERLNGGADSIREMANKLAANPADASPSQIIQMTMQCHQFMFQCELTSNVANRTSDGIQQLFRQQS